MVSSILKGLAQICVIILVSTNYLIAQESFVFTKKFSKKLDKHGIEFYSPVERWIKPVNKQKDSFLKYDMVLHSPPEIEVRIQIDKDHRRLIPTVEIVRLLSHISTNDEDAFIEYTKYPKSYAMSNYGADLAIYADFIPKLSFSTSPRGRVLILYREGEAMVKYIILYESELDPYFKFPLRFNDLKEF